ncbi:MAG: hypothetical protein ACQEQU_03685 [Spirochaetota bacterium]
MKKTNFYLIILTVIAFSLIIGGCGGEAEEEPAAPDEADEVSTASIVNTVPDLRTALSEDGTWIVAVLQDLTVEDELVVEGQFVQNDEPYRKLAFYTQDEDRNITDRYTVTAPRMIVQSENTRIQGGTFNGDVYVEANGFHLVEGTVEGDVYFSEQEYADSFSLDENSSVTGETIVQ